MQNQRRRVRFADDGTRAKKLWTYGTTFILLGIVTLIWTPLNIILTERTYMSPGMSPYKWWIDSPDTAIFKIYLFNITNADNFLSGVDEQLHFEEVGPIVYKEHLTHTNVTFNNNRTLTYVAKRWLEFFPELNKNIDLNDTINIVNVPIMGGASYLQDFPLLKILFMNYKGEHAIVNTTIYDYLWNYTYPNGTNIGILKSMYENYEEKVTVFIGNTWGDNKFFTIDRLNGKTTVPGEDEDCADTLEGSTEGLLYPQRLTNNSTLLYWRTPNCKVIELLYKNKVNLRSLTAFKYVQPEKSYRRIYNHNKTDCYEKYPHLIDGMVDVSHCAKFGFPVTLSLPHFLGVDKKVFRKISGLTPNATIHKSYAIVEPLTGVPLESRIRSQFNLIVNMENFPNSFNKFEEFQKFINMTVPMFWTEYSQMSLSVHEWIMVKMLANILPTGQVIFSSFMIIMGIMIIYLAIDFKKIFSYRGRRPRRTVIDRVQLQHIYVY